MLCQTPVGQMPDHNCILSPTVLRMTCNREINNLRLGRVKNVHSMLHNPWELIRCQYEYRYCWILMQFCLVKCKALTLTAGHAKPWDLFSGYLMPERHAASSLYHSTLKYGRIHGEPLSSQSLLLLLLLLQTPADTCASPTAVEVASRTSCSFPQAAPAAMPASPQKTLLAFLICDRQTTRPRESRALCQRLAAVCRALALFVLANITRSGRQVYGKRLAKTR